MKIESKKVTKLNIDTDKLDLISVFIDDFETGKGQITIICYGSAWTAYWGAMGGERSISEFFCSCNEHYLAKNLSRIESEIYDIDKISQDAEEKGIEFWRDDPWNDYDFLADMYGADSAEWGDSLPKKENPKYKYLCRIIRAVQTGLASSVQS